MIMIMIIIIIIIIFFFFYSFDTIHIKRYMNNVNQLVKALTIRN